jgi:molybdopterin synthase catalytic subunit
MIKIQEKNFNIEDEIYQIKSQHLNVGAVSTFIGYVRGLNNQKKVTSINLEVYKDMAYKSLEDICSKAQKKWDLIDVLIIHRFGKLNIEEKIVLVAILSMHRKESSEACNFIMDYLKKDAPFWKKEYYDNNYEWLENTRLRN